MSNPYGWTEEHERAVMRHLRRLKDEADRMGFRCGPNVLTLLRANRGDTVLSLMVGDLWAAEHRYEAAVHHPRGRICVCGELLETPR